MELWDKWKVPLVIVAALIVIGIVWATYANAADKGGDRPSFLPIQEAVDKTTKWSGVYLGAHGGYGWGEWNGDFFWQDQDMGHGYDLSTKDWLYGLQVGANHQIGKIVLGVEADITWGNGLDNAGQFQANDEVPNSYVEWEVHQKIERFGTVRVRAGYLPVPNFLMYATGGMAWAQTSANQVIHYPKANTPFVNGFGSVDENHIGWTAGGGVEWALAPNLSLRAEYLYLRFGEQDYRFVGKAGNPPSVFYADDRAPSDLDMHVIRGGLNLKLN